MQGAANGAGLISVSIPRAGRVISGVLCDGVKSMTNDENRICTPMLSITL